MRYNKVAYIFVLLLIGCGIFLFSGTKIAHAKKKTYWMPIVYVAYSHRPLSDYKSGVSPVEGKIYCMGSLCYTRNGVDEYNSPGMAGREDKEYSKSEIIRSLWRFVHKTFPSASDNEVTIEVLGPFSSWQEANTANKERLKWYWDNYKWTKYNFCNNFDSSGYMIEEDLFY